MANEDPKKILLVDDEETFLLATADLLKLNGFEIEKAHNAEDALELIISSHFDLIISDIKMPGNIDLNFIRETRKIRKNVSIILITGYPELRTAIEGIELSVGAYLVKPLEFKDLLFHIKKVLDKEKLIQQIKN
ncbi:MAG: response regulator [Calditrichaeota bacterium]|nr:MAG: response regulator [Calditrichota bacterium]MBL1206571.1 response regulator [Calditrichota bacterium]NOG46398.1 response regulator [Calditrichota bacterium]